MSETRRKRCPNGEHWNTTLKKCEKKKGTEKSEAKTKAKVAKPSPLTTAFTTLLEFNPLDLSQKTKTREQTHKRCPRGKHWDPELQQCVKKEEKHKKTRKYCPKGQRWSEAESKCVDKEHAKKHKTKKLVIVGDNQTEGLVIPKRKKLVLKAPVEEVSEPEEEEQEEEEETRVQISEITQKEEEPDALPPVKPPIQNMIDHDDLSDTDADAEDYTEEEEHLKQLYDTDIKQFLIEKEAAEREEPVDAAILYPNVGDVDFNKKIAEKKEFFDTQYDGTIHPIKQQAEKLCNAEFELMPHQTFVKNFMSLQTPYNSLLLYHNLGTGKTCSAIGIAEEMRAYMKNIGLTKKILVIASPNVQENFRFQLFDETKLTSENGVWNLNTCIGNALLSEINPTNLIGLTKDKVVRQIKSIINTYYLFMGYRELANYIMKKIKVPDDASEDPVVVKQIESKRIQTVFNNRLIIIDEVHNIRISADNDKNRAKTASLLMQVAKYAENLRLLLLSATPTYNSHTEIVWLTNLLNRVDKRSTIDSVSDIFDAQGQFKPSSEGKEGGEEILRRKLTGYVSYVRGENPYTFPYRIYPTIFAPEFTLSPHKYPTQQMNGEPIDDSLQYIPVYINTIGEYQALCYRQIMTNLYSSISDAVGNLESDNRKSFPLKLPIEALNIVYPSVVDELDEDIDSERSEKSVSESSINIGSLDPEEMVGKKGLSNCMTYEEINAPLPQRYNYEYKETILARYGRIFSRNELPKYSHKMATICSCIRRATGIVLIYSEYIDGGLVPMALALEEMGMKRVNATGTAKSLFKIAPTGETSTYKYLMITGDKAFSPDNLADVKYITRSANKSGDLVKVVLISRAAAEGLDFKNIRQVHILDPWYNMNRIEQIIGRAVRNLSHCHLPFEQRNVEIYLHATLLDGEFSDEEAADLYLYRYAEKKGVQIGRVNRLLKETAVDCILNIKQTEFTIDKLSSLAQNQNLEINLSTDNKAIVYQIGDRPFTEQCDYMDNCSFTCSPNHTVEVQDVQLSTYHVNFIQLNFNAVLKRIQQLFRERSQYKREQLIAGINVVKQYPIEQILYVLSQMIDTPTHIIVDKYGRTGRLTNRGMYYLFMPMEMTDETATVFERGVPVDVKRSALELEIPQEKVSKEEGEPDRSQGEIESSPRSRNYDGILVEIRQCLAYAMEPVVIAPKDKDWYKHAGQVISLLHTNENIPQETLIEYIVWHYLDCADLEIKLILLTRLLSVGEDAQLLGVETVIRQYFTKKMIRKSSDSVGVLLSNKESWTVYVLDTATMDWNPAKPTEREAFIRFGLKNFIVREADMNYLIGFVGLFKTEMVFKTKNLKEKRNNRGVKCDTWIKSDLLARLAIIIGDDTRYTIDTTENILKPGICVMMEMILRFYSDTKYSGKTWFLSPEEALINKIARISGKDE